MTEMTMTTSKGDIVFEMFEADAPKTVGNMRDLAEKGFYDGLAFHRIISNFMIQGGGMAADRREKATRAAIALESRNGLVNTRGSVAMARTNDPNSATAQFFINVKDNDFLNAAQARDGNGYAVFGKVTAGMDVVDRIRNAPTGPGDFPNEPVLIKRATVEK